MAFLRNTWYAALWSQDLKAGELQQRVLLNEPIVFYRNGEGDPVALFDRCPHRFAPLSMGRLCEGGRVQCAYHGLEFDDSGRCVHNPNADGRIPNAMRVKSYPLVERHSLVWIWMGERAPDPSAIPDFGMLDTSAPSLVGPRRWLKVAANYELMTYNIMDITHTSTLHAGILGNEDSYTFDIKAEERGDTLWLRRSFSNVRPMGVNRLMFRKDIDRVDQWAHMRWNAPACILNDAGVCPPGKSIDEGTGLWGVHFLTPESETSTYYHFCAILRNPVVRSAAEDEEIQREMAELRRIAFDEQDKRMLEAQQRMINLAGGMAAVRAVPLSTDAATMRFKRILERLIEQEHIYEHGHPAVE
jgi:phenylpropionate dioxygenase-like ring-hydroxylating dioxygenase large terminal subunit